MIRNILIIVSLLSTNISAWSLFDTDNLFKGDKTYGLLIHGTGHTKAFLQGLTYFSASPIVTHLEESISIIKDSDKGAERILKSDAYKEMIDDAKFQCDINRASPNCKVHILSMDIIQTAIELKNTNN
jgi:hypothetical protein